MTSKNSIFGIIVLIVFGFLLWFIFKQGEIFELGKTINKSVISYNATTESRTFIDLCKGFSQNFYHPLAILILQIVIIIISARILGWLMTKMRQPAVVGEIIAGIILGPSLIGMLFPNFSNFLFPTESLGILQSLSQIGLIFFMFIIGMDLDLRYLRKKVYDAILISNISIMFPFLLGVILSYFLYTDYAPTHISFPVFALFMGIAMSITAFPVLARIVQERNLTKTTLGTIVIASAAANDITGWCILAVIIAIVKAGTIIDSLFTIVLSVLYVIFMMYLIAPLLNRLANTFFTRETISKPIVAIIFGVLLLSSYLTETIGIHALFGAFIAGLIIPSNSNFRMILKEKIEDLSIVLLLPLFFVFTGLRTQIGLLNESHLWGTCLIIILVAVTGKFIGSAFAAKYVGNTWKDSLTIGVLMNTRGLMELIVLNIGYELGILSPEIFTMLVLMALVTTFMTGPAINAIEYFSTKYKKVSVPPDLIQDNNILISFGSPKTGSRLLKLAVQMNFNDKINTNITALHLTPTTDISIQNAKVFEKEGFEPITIAAQKLGVNIHKHYKVANDVSREVTLFANQGNFDLMLVGSSRSLFSSDKTGGKVKYFFDGVKCNVGVLIDKGFDTINRILMIVEEPTDNFLTRYNNKFLEVPDNHLTIIDNNQLLTNDSSLWGIRNDSNQDRIMLTDNSILHENTIHQYDLIIISLSAWNKAKQKNAEWLNYSPSVLILSSY